jgi:type II secretory pathway pseudopilin PulG
MRATLAFTIICGVAQLGHRPAPFVAEFAGRAHRMRKTVRNKRQAGFSTLELLVVITMSAIITAIAVPAYVKTAAYLRAAGDIRSINGLTALAKMRAASDFTHARVFADLNGGTFQLEVWDKTGNGGAGCWFADLDVNRACLTYSSGRPSGPVNTLAQGDTFGFGTLASGPTPGQPTPSQAGACLDNSNASLGANTACIVFNSRGIPIDATNSPVATGAFYLTNGAVVNVVTVSATGSMQTWSSPADTAYWYGQ